MKRYVQNVLSLLLLFSLAMGGVYAQTSLNASGGNATGSDGSASYSVGQVFYLIHEGTTGSVEDGVQHAYEIYTLGTENLEQEIFLSVYPNPTADNLMLKVSDGASKNWFYQLYDLQGNRVREGEVQSQSTKIEMGSFSKSAYFLHILDNNNKEVQIFKIIKN